MFSRISSLKHLSLAVLFLIGAAGCSTIDPLGLVFTHVKTPVAATGNSVGHRSGESCAYRFFLGWVAIGDRSIETARKNGGITSITSVDESMTGVPLFFSSHCTIVRGR